MSQPDEMFPHPSELIGRSQEMDAIMAVLDAPPYHQVFYLYGSGGIGKTRLLIETHQRARKRPQVLSTGIIDLYHGYYHQPLLLMDALVERLRAALRRVGDDRVVFTRYEQVAHQYRLQSAAGHSRQRQRVDTAFIDDYSRIAEDYPIVLLIDTFEKLHPIIDGTEQFNFSLANRLEDWLMRRIKRLPNTLTVLAGRSRPKQLDLLQKKLGSRWLKPLQIQPFSVPETAEYIQQALGEVPDDVGQQELYAILHQASGGRPIVLALALASAKMFGFDITALPPHFKDPYPANSEAFVDLLLKDFQREHPELANLLSHTFYLRKGLDVAFLRQINWIDEDESSASILQEFRELPFVKVIGDDLITLHDVAYEILFGKLAATEENTLYDKKIKLLDQELQQLTKDAEAGSAEATQKRQAKQIEHLFYLMSWKPVAGYQEYRELCNSAIIAKDEDFDTQLQNELADFFERSTAWGDYYRNRMEVQGISWEQLVFDEGVRWVYRRIEKHTSDQATNRYLAAIEIADQVKQAYPAVYTRDVLERCALDVARLSAEIYDSPRTSIEILQEYAAVTQQLEMLLPRFDADSDSLLAEANRRYTRFVLALAYNGWGYYERKLQHLHSAIEKYKKAVGLFKGLGTESDILRATTLNNLGFALFQQGELDRGLFFVKEAARLATAQGSKHRFAICKNTMAQIKNELIRTSDALEDVLQARSIFKEVKSTRNSALCAKAEGDVRRWLAYRNRSDWQRSQQEYARAIKRYHEALELFDCPEISEPLRRVEVRQALGCAHRSRGKVFFEAGKDCSEDMATAEWYLQAALDLVSELAQQDSQTPLTSDLLEDIAVIYVNQDRFDEALPWLDQAQAHVPKEFQIVEGQGIVRDEKTLQLPIYWLRLGPIEFQRALCFIALGQSLEGCRQLLCAYAYISAFSLQAPQFRALHNLGTHALVLYVKDRRKLEELRIEIYWAAQQLHIEHAFTGIDQVFDHAIEESELL